MTLPDDIFDQNQANNNNISSITKHRRQPAFSLPCSCCWWACRNPQAQTAFQIQLPGTQFCKEAWAKPLWLSQRPLVSVETQQLLPGATPLPKQEHGLCGAFPGAVGPALPKMPKTLTVSSLPWSLNRLEANSCWQQVWLNVRKCSIPLLQGWHQGAFPAEETGFQEHARSIPRAEKSSLPPFQGRRPHHWMSRCSSYIQRFP